MARRLLGTVAAELRELLDTHRNTDLQPNGRASTEPVAFLGISAWAKAHGVTRLACTTLLDRLGIANYYAVRPSAKNSSAIISSGKGPTPRAAALSALYEALERWASEIVPRHIHFGSYDHMRRTTSGSALLSPASVSAQQEFFWTEGLEVIGGKPCLMPLEKVMFPCDAKFDCNLFQQDTNGLAAGTNAVEALCAAIFEIIERDAVVKLDFRNAERVRPDSLGPSVGAMHANFVRAGVEVALYACESCIPVFFAISRDGILQWPHLFCNGAGAHLDPEIAAMRALTEVSQSRATIMSGVRDDIIDKVDAARRDGFQARYEATAPWFLPEPAPYRGSPAAWTGRSFSELYDALLGRLSAALPALRIGCSLLYASDGLYVIRAYSPDLCEYDD